MKVGLIAVIIIILSCVATARAQTSDHASCALWKAKWSDASKGADLAAIDDVIGKIPGLCTNLKQEASARRAIVAKDAATRKAANEAARQANDPCQQGRNDWNHVEAGSEATLQAYIGELPAACGVWKSKAQERLDVVVKERIAKEEEKKRADDLILAARATAIEGRWAWEAMGASCSNPKTTGTTTIEIKDGAVIRSYWDFGSKLVALYAITRVAGNAVFSVETSPGPAGQGETSFSVTGDRLIVYQPQKSPPGEFMKPASTQGYKRC